MTTPEGPVYRALSMLENEYMPLLRRRAPYWRPRPAPCSRDVHTPDWNWVHPGYNDGLQMDLTFLDANGAFVSAASSADFAHGELEHTGALAAYRGYPGFYRIQAHGWSHPDVVSPLGSAELPQKIWVSHPTVELLAQLETAGVWPDLTILDSWTCTAKVRFREWATAVNSDRADALRAVATNPEHDPAEEPGKCGCTACVWYTAVKNGYSMAVQLMLGPAEGGKVKSAVKRPDWYYTIHAQHAASTWRKVWKCVVAGHVPVMMGSVDEVVWDSMAFEEIKARGLLKLDDTGVQLGAFKVKREITAAAS